MSSTTQDKDQPSAPSAPSMVRDEGRILVPQDLERKLEDDIKSVIGNNNPEKARVLLQIVEERFFQHSGPLPPPQQLVH
jgi:hypothetical protein